MNLAKGIMVGNYHKSNGFDHPRMGISSIRIDGQAFSAITAYGIHLVDQGQIVFDPIPLNTDWLKKFEFVLDTKVWWSFPNNECDGIELLDQWPHKYFSLTVDKVHLAWEPIEYVHQLQNIHLLFTGKELK